MHGGFIRIKPTKGLYTTKFIIIEDKLSLNVHYLFLDLFVEMAKRKLHIEVEYDFKCYGLSCHQKDYRLAWHINNVLDTRLVKIASIEIKEPLFQEDMFFPRFGSPNEEEGISYTLIGNRNKWGFLIPEESNIDYFLLISSERFDENLILNELRSINIVLSLTKIDLDTLKSKDRLLY